MSEPTISAAPIGTPPPTDSGAGDYWHPIGTLGEFADFVDDEDRQEPMPIVPVDEIARFAWDTGWVPKSTLISIGPDGIGRCRLCPYEYVASGWWPHLDWLAGQLQHARPATPKRAARRRTR